MANNRLWAVCKDDNECACLGKSYGEWTGLHSPDDFFAKHTKCPSQHGGGENILFVTENEDGENGRVILFDFSQSHNETDEHGNEYTVRDNRIYLKGDEDSPQYKKWLNRNIEH